MKRILTGILLICLTLCLAAASADSLTLSGTVIPGETVPVYAPIGGTVGDVTAEAGQRVSADDVLVSMKTTRVYAPEDGTVTGIFGQPGDSADSVSDKYGAVMYLEGSSLFSVSASTSNSYYAAETKIVHAGEPVWLLCRSSSDRNGTGIVTAVSGTSFTVQVTGGTFIPGDSVDVYRDEAYTNSLKIGRGNIERVSPTAVTASGSIVRIAVSDGDQVKRGDLLLETLDGSFDGLYMSGTDIAAGQDGVLSSLNVSRGDSVQKGSVVAVIYPLSSMLAEVLVPEDSVGQIREGDSVTVELEADESKSYPGTVKMISSVADTTGDETSYRVLVSFTPDDAVRFGMSIVVSTAEPEADPAEAENREDTGEEDTSGKTDKPDRGERPKDFSGKPDGEKPEGFPEWSDGEKPEGFPEKPESSPSEEGQTDDSQPEDSQTEESAEQTAP